MNKIDENGTWEINNGVEMLIEPSEAWVLLNQPLPTMEQLLIPIRLQRNALLADCDWTQLSDSPLSVEKKSEWAIYRQLLRDFPETVNLENIIYPTKPE